jgi:hypothetical protein
MARVKAKPVVVDVMRLDYELANQVLGYPVRGSPDARRVKDINGVLASRSLTAARHSDPTISRLVDSGRICAVALQAITEIENVYTYLCSGLMVRGINYRERVDSSESPDPTWFVDAYQRRYKNWANQWSARKNSHGDPTLQIVFDVIFSEMTGKDIDSNLRLRNGTAISAFVAGVRDYAALSGWVDGTTAARWKSEARQTFPMRRVPKANAVL